MAKRENIIRAYEQATQRLFADKSAFAEYLGFSGRFYKMPSSQVIMLFDDNPKATMVADYETWQRFGHRLKPGSWSTDVLSNGKVKQLFDISMTRSENPPPYQWTLDKKTAEEFVNQFSRENNCEFAGMTACINYIADKAVESRIEDVLSFLGISEENEAKFTRSFNSMVRRVIAARCEWKSDFTYGGKPNGVDLSALDLLESSDEAETLLEQIQITANAELRSMEHSINNIINERKMDYERIENADRARDEGIGRGSSASVVRGGEDVSAVDNDARRENVSSGRADVSVQPDDGNSADARGERADGVADKPLGQGMATVYDGEFSGGRSEAAGQNVVGADSEENRPRSVGNLGENARGISSVESAPDNRERDSVGGAAAVTYERTDSEQSGERPQNSTVNPENMKTTEENSPAVSFSEQVDNALAGKTPFYSALWVCDTPQILIDVGCRQLPMLYTQKHLKDALKPQNKHQHFHGLSVEQIKKLPDLIKNPVMIYDSLSQNDSIVVVTEEFDKNDNPIIVSIKPNGNGRYELETIDSNFITSVYGRENFIKQLEKVKELDKLLFADKEKSQEMFERWGLQSSELTNSLDFNIIIHQSRNIVNPFSEKISENSQEILENVTPVAQSEDFIPYNEKKAITATRVGDFYEFYGEDAKELSEKFNLTLTTRNGEPMVGVPAYAFDDYCSEWYDRGYIVTNWSHYQEVIMPRVSIPESLIRAESLINDFCEKEYNSEGDFSNRIRVGLAYTNDEETGYPIEVYADLEYFRIMTEFNHILVSEEKYKTLDEMCDLALEHLDFDDLVYLSEDKRAKIIPYDRFAEFMTAEISGNTSVKNAFNNSGESEFVLEINKAVDSLFTDLISGAKKSEFPGEFLTRLYNRFHIDKSWKKYIYTLAAENVRDVLQKVPTEREIENQSANTYSTISESTESEQFTLFDLEDSAPGKPEKKIEIDADKNPELAKAIDALKSYALGTILYHDVVIRETFRSSSSTRADFDSEVQRAINNAVTDFSHGELTSELAEKEDFSALYWEMYENREFAENLYSEISDMLYTKHAEIDKARQFAHENGIPYDEYPYDSEENFDPYAYDPNRMSDEDYDRMHDLIDAERAEAEKLIGAYIRIDGVDYRVDGIAPNGSVGFLAKLHSENGAELTERVDDVRDWLEMAWAESIPHDLGKFYINHENETVTEVYYNPDSSEGGQLVYNHFTFDQIFDAIIANDPLEYLAQVSRQELVDVTAPNFTVKAGEFLANNEDFNSREDGYLKKLRKLPEPTYSIFQLRETDSLRDYRFAGMAELHERGLYVDRENYRRVYRGRFADGETLEDIFTRFNVNSPEDFDGHSLSVGDIIGITRDGKSTAHYVDSAGFEEIPDFLLDLEERRARRTLMDNIDLYAENMLASDEMDDLGDYLFDKDYEYHFDGLKIGDNNFPFSELHKLAEKYKNGEDIRAELARGMYALRGEIEYYGKYGYDYPNPKIKVTRDEGGMTFGTQGGFEISYSWEQLGGAMIFAARKEYARHEMWDRACEISEIINAVRDGKTAKISEKSDNHEEQGGIIENARKPKFDNITLNFDNERGGFYLTADTPNQSGAVITVFPLGDRAVADYLYKDVDLEETAELNGIEFRYIIDDKISDDVLNVTGEEYRRMEEQGFDASQSDFSHSVTQPENESIGTGTETPENVSRVTREVPYKLMDEKRAEAEKLIDKTVRIEDLDYQVEGIISNGADGFAVKLHSEPTDKYNVGSTIYEDVDVVREMLERQKHQEIENTIIDNGRVGKSDTYIRGENFQISAEISEDNFSPKSRYAANIAAIKTLQKIESENRAATPDEQKILARYVGWGGIPQVFDSENSAWSSEYSELKNLLTDAEYADARGSTLNAHYTSATVINAIYKAVGNMGFKSGNVLEPSMGIGNFFGAMPKKMRDSKLFGVELDSITGRIARQLYPNAEIQINGYENTNFPDNFFDLAVGNVPFGNYSVADRKYDKEHFLIHDYFFAKTLDKVAPGGIVAFITSKGTLDKANSKTREYLAKRADLVGAIRLPNNAFKANAGTEVTSDIIFLQKREKMAVENPDWCYIGNNEDGIPVNQYFLDHPEMILGKMQMTSGRFGQEATCEPTLGADLAEQLDRAVMRLQKDIVTSRREVKRNEERGEIPATADVRNFTFTAIDNKIYFRENNIMREMPFNKRTAKRMLGLIGVRNAFRRLVDAQTEGCSDDVLADLQYKLNTEYDKFTAEFGHVSDIENRKVFSVDDDYNTLCGGLELINPETKEVTKADIFTKRTIKPYTEITRVDTPQEALSVSLDMRGKVDIDYISALCETPKDEVIVELLNGGLIYKNPETENYEESAEYLSGYVREKLRAAQNAAKGNPEYERNVAALEKVQPPKLGAGDISVRLGAPWITIEDYCNFFEEYAHGVLRKSSVFGKDPVLYRSVSGEYKIENKGADKSVASQSSFGTKRMSSYYIFENLLNNRDISVYDSLETPDGKKIRVMNSDETQLAQEKARLMREAFPKWLWENTERREKYVGIYNELFNSLVGREYDGSHQTFPGMNPFIELNEHQKNAVMRAKLGGNTLLAHCVGAGKSFEMVAATMEKKRLGLINKACVVVPKHLVGQMAAEWQRLYPEARLLTAKENDFNEVNRQKFIGRCCTGDYDAVIMSYEQFQKIPMSVEYQRDFLMEQIDGLTEHLGDYNGMTLFADEKRSVKDLERMKKNIESKLKKLLDSPRDNSLSFEQLGFDSIVVDEAHNYKNGLVVTKMKNVSGIGSKAAKKCEDFLMKTQYLNEKYGERNIILASGTPVSNSMSELYILQQYLRPSALRRQGLQNFDDWASTFGEVVSQIELKPAGDGFRTKKRFAKFVNLSELMSMYKDFADIRTAEMLNLPVPEIEGGKPQVISAKPNEFQRAYMKVLAARSESIHNGSVDPREDNMLKVTNEARLLGLDARCVNPDADNYPNSKVNLLIEKVMEIYTETTEQKGVQAIFCDIAINEGKKNSVEIDVEPDEQMDDGEKTLSAEEQAEMLGASKFSVYKYIKEELIRRGIPENEICFAGDAKNQGQRGEMYAQLRAGTKRIVLASTTKMGTGANVQTRLCALHHLDIPWKPSDLEQREGRIIRQGNTFSTVKIFNYVTEGTFDAYMLNLIVTKQKFISQLMSGKTPARTCEDVDEMVLNYSEMQAIASGDPRIKEKIELDIEVSRLRLLESEHLNKKYQLEDKSAYCNAQISIAKKHLELAHNDKEFAAKNALPNGEFRITINGKILTERKDAGAELRKAQLTFLSKKQHMDIGEYRGFKLSINWGMIGQDVHTVALSISRTQGLTYSTELELQNDLGNITRLENILKLGIDKRISQLESDIARNEKDLAEVERTKDAPFEHADELREKSARLAQLDSELGVGKQDEVVIDESQSKTQDDHGTDKNLRGQNKKPKHPKH